MMFAAPQGDFGFDDATGTITRYFGTGGDVEIPATINGTTVTSIGDFAFGYSGLTGITLPEGVTSIGDSAFKGCFGLTSIMLPASVTSIGNSAFSYCFGLTSITLPEGITNIGGAAFVGCYGLTSITIPAGVTSIGNAAFNGCSGLTSLVLPEGVTSIGNSAFDGCSGLTSLVLPEGVTSIGNYAFSYSGLTSITLPEGVTSIGDYAFYSCSGLTSITIPASVTSVSNGAFSLCSGLTSITIPASVTSIGNYAFKYCSGLTSITIPASVTSVSNGAFSYCSGLTSLSLPAGVTSIGDYAFYNCSGLTSISIPAGVTSIGQSAFSDCSGLTSITLPAGVTNIGFSAFLGCSGLTSLVLPVGVTSIGSYAFEGCSSLKSVYCLGNAPTTVGTRAFDAVPATIYFPADKTGWTNPFQGLPAVAIAVSLSPSSIAENNLVGAAVGTFSINDPNSGTPLTYTLVSGEGSTNNDSFSIVGNQLKAAATFNYEAKHSFTVRVRGVEPGGLVTEKAFAITVTDVAEAPTAPTVVAPARFTILEDTPTGLTFTGTPFADADSPASKAMTVTLKVAGGAIAATSADGIAVAGSAAARTFTGTIANLNTYFTATPKRITYTPAANSNAAIALTTTIAESSGTKTLSSKVASTLAITPVNDAPSVFAPKSFTVTEDLKGNLRWPAASTPFADIDSPRLTVTLSVADGTITAASTAAVTVGGTTTARTFTATPAALNAYFKALGTIGYTTALDNTIPRTLTTTVSDGALSASASTTIAITPVNDAPTINLAAVLGGGKIGTPYEITYETLRTALNAADAETAAPTIVIQAIKSGSLQTWSGTAWVTVATAAALPRRPLSLSEGQKIRWLPPAGVSGAQQAFDVKARDGLLYSTTTAKVTVSLAQA